VSLAGTKAKGSEVLRCLAKVNIVDAVLAKTLGHQLSKVHLYQVEQASMDGDT
jgi:hypothetical protein